MNLIKIATTKAGEIIINLDHVRCIEPVEWDDEWKWFQFTFTDGSTRRFDFELYFEAFSILPGLSLSYDRDIWHEREAAKE